MRQTLNLTKIARIRVSHTKNCRASGQADLLKRFTAIFFWFSNFPLNTTLGAPCSETIFSTAKLDVAILSCSMLYSRNAGRSPSSPFCSSSDKQSSKHHEIILKHLSTFNFRLQLPYVTQTLHFALCTRVQYAQTLV